MNFTKPAAFITVFGLWPVPVSVLLILASGGGAAWLGLFVVMVVTGWTLLAAAMGALAMHAVKAKGSTKVAVALSAYAATLIILYVAHFKPYRSDITRDSQEQAAPRDRSGPDWLKRNCGQNQPQPQDKAQQGSKGQKTNCSN